MMYSYCSKSSKVLTQGYGKRMTQTPLAGSLMGPSCDGRNSGHRAEAG